MWLVMGRIIVRAAALAPPGLAPRVHVVYTPWFPALTQDGTRGWDRTVGVGRIAGKYRDKTPKDHATAGSAWT
jgi:hypothetical protein